MPVRRVAVAAGLVGLGLTAAPVAAAQPGPDDDIRDYPVAQGRYSTPDDFYHVFFKTPDGLFCGIGPNGGPVGCDAVPRDAPPGTDQTVVNSWAPAEYRHSGARTFTRDVDVLPVGYRLENWGATCAVEDVGVVRCETYNSHGFRLSADYGELW
ncbi:hypothetical protein H7I53_19745 [Mycolicibacterium pulveris]|uniref:Secreted protein n=1 Tax=Mycolicibacterium pulveris TaxID=36813 RepID=A0A7I7URB3_MYCPV|nr:hypothetical protein [Mycolicibacterium pulveris]MCV6982446.1 hypothetical protein [Mycolicibacterium pulveris]BBY83897.1 hypothetical protein MPUL_50550 [Mycolicibacterium pulveris]